METIVRGVLEFTQLLEDNPHLLDLTTREVLSRLRGWLDERHPSWRAQVNGDMNRDGKRTVEVEMLFDSRTIRGTILQRPSKVGA